MRAKIVRRQAAGDPESLPGDLHPVLRRVYANRGVCDPGELDLSLSHLLTPDGLKDIDRATELLQRALTEGWHIMVVGDFDADGATATAVALSVLRVFGAAKVSYVVPDRFTLGYGLTPGIVELAAGHSPDLLITVDNGIASLAGVAAARAKGMRVLITDHHLPGAELPAADAIVNPNQPGCGFASKHLAGVGVIFYLMLALRARLREAGWFAERDEPNLADYLDLVALGTIADLVPLDRNNRILVEQGLRRIRAGQARRGIQALLRVAGRDPMRAVSADFGFAVAPRLNAAGRLTDMSVGIECLLSQDESEARSLAQRLDKLNRERRERQADMQAEALAAVDNLKMADVPVGICLYESGWHQGIVGLVASKVKERWHRPVIAFAPAGDEGMLKGSARSVPGFHIRDALEAVATRHPGVIERFGGHAMAAGLSLAANKLEVFEQAFDAEARRHLEESQLKGVVETDGSLVGQALDLKLAEVLRRAGPWGQAFPAPLFDDEFTVVEQRVVGERHLKLKLAFESGSRPHEAIAFHQEPLAGVGGRLRMAYRPEVNEYRSMYSPQLIIESIKEP